MCGYLLAPDTKSIVRQQGAACHHSGLQCMQVRSCLKCNGWCVPQQTWAEQCLIFHWVIGMSLYSLNTHTHTHLFPLSFHVQFRGHKWWPALRSQSHLTKKVDMLHICHDLRSLFHVKMLYLVSSPIFWHILPHFHTRLKALCSFRLLFHPEMIKNIVTDRKWFSIKSLSTLGNEWSLWGLPRPPSHGERYHLCQTTLTRSVRWMMNITRNRIESCLLWSNKGNKW